MKEKLYCTKCGKELSFAFPEYMGMKNGEKTFKYFCKEHHNQIEAIREASESIHESRVAIDNKMKTLRDELRALDEQDKTLFETYQNICAELTQIDYDLAKRMGMARVQ